MYQTLAYYDFEGAATSPGAAGTTTGAGDGWIDTQGNRFYKSGGKLLGLSSAPISTSYTRDYLSRPGGEFTVGTVRVSHRFVPSDWASPDAYMLMALRAAADGNTFMGLFLEFVGSEFIARYYRRNSASSFTPIAVPKFAEPENPGNVHRVTFETIGMSPTLFRATMIDETAGISLGRFEVSDNTAALQITTHKYMLGVWNAGSPVTWNDALLEFDPAPTAMAFGAITVASSTAADSITVNWTGGAAPFTLEIFANEADPGFVAAVGNRIVNATGLTASPYTTTDLPTANPRYYRFHLTDANGDLVRYGTTLSGDVQTPALASYYYASEGDSLTNGYQLATPATQAPGAVCASDLSAALGRPVVHINRGVIGSTVASWAPGGANYNNAKAAILAAVPTGARLLMSMMWGANDSNNSNRVSKANFKAGLKAIIDQHLIDYAAFDLTIWLHDTGYILPSTPGYDDASLHLLRKRYNAAMNELVAAYATSNPGKVLRGDTGKHYEYLSSRFLTDMVAEPSAVYLHNNVSGAAFQGHVWSSVMLATLKPVPPASKVLAGTNYDLGLVGGYVEPDVARVVSGYTWGYQNGKAGQFTPGYPAANLVFNGTVFGDSYFGGRTGSATAPSEAQALAGVSWQIGATVYNGRYFTVSADRVLAPTTFGVNNGETGTATTTGNPGGTRPPTTVVL